MKLKWIIILGFLFHQLTLQCKSRFISDSLIINLSGKFTEDVIMDIERSYSVLIDDSIALKMFRKSVVPEELDPTFIHHYNVKCNEFFVLENYYLHYHKASVNSKSLNKPKTESLLFRESFDENYGTYKRSYIELNEIELGDTINVSYRYHFQVIENLFQTSSLRWFLNDQLPKDTVYLEVNYKTSCPFSVDFKNIVDSKLIEDTAGTDIKVRYSDSNLKAGLMEIGSRAYQSMPHLLFFQKTFDKDLQDNVHVIVEHDFYINKDMLTAILSLREGGFYGMNSHLLQSLNATQLNKIQAFSNSLNTKDSLPYFKFKGLVNSIADNFDFDDNEKIYQLKNEFHPKYGDSFENKEIEDISRYMQYSLLLRLDSFEILSCALMDKRVGKLNNSFFRSVNYSDLAIVSPTISGNVNYFLPISNRYRYYLGELPFYYEDASAFVFSKSGFTTDSDEPVFTREIKLPKSTFKDNSRKTMMNGVVENNQLVLNGQIALAGQFSTLTRNLYRFNIKDETINPEYNEFLWGDSADVVNLKYHVEVESDEFPFPAKVFTQFNLPLEGNKIELSKLINHVSIKNLSKNRVQPYFPDFEGSDSFFYMLNIGEYENLSVPENINIDNDFASYGFNVKEQNGQIMVSSILKIKTDFVEAKNIHQVTEIYDAIEKVELGLLKWD